MFGINASVKNISRHAKVHIKDYLIEKKESTKNDQRNIFSKEQEDYIAEKISLFIPLSTQTFQYSNDEFLRAQTSSLPTIEENAIINYWGD